MLLKLISVFVILQNNLDCNMRVPEVVIESYEKSMLKQPIHLHMWFDLTDELASHILTKDCYDEVDEEAMDILGELHNMFYNFRVLRHRRIHKMETGTLSKQVQDVIQTFVDKLKSTAYYYDFQFFFIRLIACVFCIDLDFVRSFFELRIDYSNDEVGDYQKILDDFERSNIVNDKYKELLGMGYYDVCYPKFDIYNLEDTEPFPRLMFEDQPRYHPSIDLDEGLIMSCDCNMGCTNSCPCRDSGFTNAHDIIPICSIKCGCACENTYATQFGGKSLLDHLEIFKTEDRGWGVRAKKRIKADTYIGEYCGEVFRGKIEKHRQLLYKKYDFYYTFALDRHILDDQQPDYFLDATYFGNITRFFNHDCKKANLTQIYVLLFYLVSFKIWYCSATIITNWI
eukprot:NODE_522_length_6531_cov_0.547575.p4 type:complete len:398 gc:universal NODE_522_length_6531_cov_0.547575:4184-2991(-)